MVNLVLFSAFYVTINKYFYKGENMKDFKRASSFIIVTLIYLFATAVGVGVYIICPFHFAINLLIADICATVCVFLFSVIFSNASVYDPYWSVQPPVIVTAFAIFYGLNALGVALIISVWFWAIRLTANWAYTFNGLSHQDWRYTLLKQKTGALYPVVNFTGIHLVPTLVVYGCTLPAVYAIINGWQVNPLSFAFCVLAICSASMQGVADIQMHKFRKNKTSNFNRNGLWKYSRHPNYLGEILQWWGVGLAVFFASQQWLLLIGALCNTLLFVFISIPLADGRQCQKQGWEEYKSATRALLPVYKKP